MKTGVLHERINNRCMKTTMVRLSPRLHRMWREAAEREEISRAAFLRLALRDRVREVLLQEKEIGDDDPTQARKSLAGILADQSGSVTGLRGTKTK